MTTEEQGRPVDPGRRALDHHRYVFVVTYGRSGSTLLQGFLNALPRTVVRGENGLYVLSLYRALADVRAFRARHDGHGGKSPTSAFYGVRRIRARFFWRAMNDIVSASVLGSIDPSTVDVIGFKEVLWHRVEPEEVAGFFDAMDHAFPGVRYVLNTRATAEVLGSGFWRRTDQDEARRLIDRVVEIQQHLRTTRPDRVVDVEYGVLAGDDEQARDDQLRALGEFVTGEPLDDDRLATMLEAASRPHGPNPKNWAADQA